MHFSDLVCQNGLTKGLFLQCTSIVRGVQNALKNQPVWEKGIHIFWLLGPFILLIERSPADIWLSLIGLAFIFRAVARRDGNWLSLAWVRLTFLFWVSCLLSAALSPLPFYSLGEAFAWIRFPIFAMAIVFWLGRDSRLIYGILLSVGVGMAVMCLILTAEVLITGYDGQRLSWPYGDLVPGNYLAKVCLPAFVVLVALGASAEGRVAGIMAIFAAVSLVASLLTGERINLLLRVCSGILAAFVWKPRPYRVIAVLCIIGAGILIPLMIAPVLFQRFFENFIAELPINVTSQYFRAMAPGWLAFTEFPLFGVGPGNLRFLCSEIISASTAYDCHPHPHNFYLQMLGEAGFVGLLTGSLCLGSIIWSCARPAFRGSSNVIVASMWIVPFAFFWPLATTADFFGQWNNVFTWSAVAIALAGSNMKPEQPNEIMRPSSC